MATRQRKLKGLPVPSASIPSSSIPSSTVGAIGSDPNTAIAISGLKSLATEFRNTAIVEEAEEIARAKAATKAISDTTEFQVKGGIAEIARTSPNNPGMIQEDTEKIIQDGAQLLPKLARPAFIVKYRNVAAVEIAKANKNAITAIQNTAALNDSILQAQRTAELKRVSMGRFSSDPDTQEAANTRVQALFEDRREEMAETVIGHDGLSQPKFSEKMQVDSFIYDRDTSLLAGLEGRFDESADKGETLLEYTNGTFLVGIDVPGSETTERGVTETDVVFENPLNLVNPQRASTFITRMTKKLTQETKADDEREKEEAVVIKSDQDITEIFATDSILNPSPENPRITFEQTAEAVKTNQMRLAQGLRVMKLLEKPDVAIKNNLNVERFIRDGIAAGFDMDNDIADALGNNHLKDERAIQLSNLNRSEEIKAIERDVKTLRRLIGTASEFGGPLEPAEIQAEEFREDAAIEEFRERAQGLLVEERTELRNKIIERAKLDPDIVGTDRLVVPEGLGLSRAQIGANPIVIDNSYNKLKRDFREKKITRRAFARRARELTKWQSAINAMDKITGKPIPKSGQSAAVKAAQGK